MGGGVACQVELTRVRALEVGWAVFVNGYADEAAAAAGELGDRFEP